MATHYQSSLLKEKEIEIEWLCIWSKGLEGDLILVGEPSSVSTSYLAAFQDAIMEVAIKARDLGFRLILCVNDCKRIEQVCSGRS